MNEMYRAAIHESGHVIVARALGAEVRSAFVAHDGTGLVTTRTRGPDRHEQTLIISMAGPLAEHLVAGVPREEVVDGGDREVQARLMKNIAELRHQPCRDRAEMLVRRFADEIQEHAAQLLMESVTEGV